MRSYSRSWMDGDFFPTRCEVHYIGWCNRQHFKTETLITPRTRRQLVLPAVLTPFLFSTPNPPHFLWSFSPPPRTFFGESTNNHYPSFSTRKVFGRRFKEQTYYYDKAPFNSWQMITYRAYPYNWESLGSFRNERNRREKDIGAEKETESRNVGKF